MRRYDKHEPLHIGYNINNITTYVCIICKIRWHMHNIFTCVEHQQNMNRQLVATRTISSTNNNKKRCAIRRSRNRSKNLKTS